MPTESKSADNLDTLLQQTRAELRRRLEAGLSTTAEAFLEALPALAADTERALDLIVTEFDVRRALGQRPDPEEWFRRFPKQEHRLRQHFARHGVFSEETASAVENAPTGSFPSGHDTLIGGGPTRALGPYEILDQIGKGGMGIVYRARDRILNRVVALKVLPAHLLGEAERVDRFLREARAAAQLRHPHLVPVLGVGQSEGRHWYAMPLLTGGTLAARLSDERDPRAAVTLLEKIARGVQAAHEKGIVHRDLKPGNILLDETGEPLVADFGLAKLADVSVELTRSGQQLGTPAYMAPEQAAGHNDRVGPASDVWALGVILFRLFTGQAPFPAKTNHQVIQQILHTEPPRPRSLRRALPADLEAVVLKCLEKDPARRYPDAGALADDLRNWLDDKPVVARPTNWCRRAGRTLRKRLKETVFLGLLVGILPLYLLLRPSGEKPTSTPTPDPAPEAIRFLQDGELIRAPRWVAGEGKFQMVNGDLRVEPAAFPGRPRTKILTLCELLARVPWPRYRFRAEVQQVDVQKGLVGLYVAHTEHQTGRGSDHWFVALKFDERVRFPPTKPGGKATTQATLQVHRYRPPGRDRGFSHTADVPKDRRFHPKLGEWRKLTIEATPETIRAYWGKDKAHFSHLIRATLMKEAVQHLASLPPLPLKPPPPLPATSSGLGLLCDASTALFRDVIVEPLMEDE
jgi:serine/threonine protein kinase